MYTDFNTKAYIYKNMKICGGGFVTGILFHPKAKNRLYIRTDIGGVYRYDFEEKVWDCLCEDTCAYDLTSSYPLAIAVDENNSDSLFVACGDKRKGIILISTDCGKTFVSKNIPCKIHGNEVGRATGERLFFRDGKIIFGSQSEGIFVSDDMGDSWKNYTVNGEKNISCMYFANDNKTVIIGCSGENNSLDNVERGNTLYYSNDDFMSFHILTSPQPQKFENATYNGYVPQRIACDGKFIYITFSLSGKIVYGGMGAYACDTGSLSDGRILKYEIGSDGLPKFVDDITPTDKTDDERKKINGGYSAICCDGKMLIASTVCRRDDDIIYRSFDGGHSWEKLLQGLAIGKVDWSIGYMKPEYNGNASCIHWISDFKISPHNSNFGIFNTGTGIFITENLCDKNVEFKPFCDGIEETVHMNVYSLPYGKTKVLDLVGDLGGFAFSDYDKACENTFADEKNDRYITCVNADFPLKGCEKIVVTPRGNWRGQTKGGLIISENQGKDWRHISCPRGITEKINRAADEMELPNTDSGWVTISADGKRISWAMARHCSSDMTVYTDDEGKSWGKSEFFDLEKRPLEETSVRLYSDYYDENVSYAILFDYRIFVSVDKSETFFEKRTVALNNIPFKFGTLCRQPDRPYTFYVPTIDGLHRFEFVKNEFTCENILAENDYALAVGFGKGKSNVPSMYISGSICNTYGFFMSDDLGKSWTRINDDAHQFGNINSICGDMREYGRFIIGSGTKGLLYGKAKESE